MATIKKDEKTGEITKQDNLVDGDLRLFHLKIYSPFKIYFDEPAYSITAENDTGPFDILAVHHNFMTLINPCEMLIEMPRGQEKIAIERGVMHVKANEVTVFLDV